MRQPDRESSGFDGDGTGRRVGHTVSLPPAAIRLNPSHAFRSCRILRADRVFDPCREIDVCQGGSGGRLQFCKLSRRLWAKYSDYPTSVSIADLRLQLRDQTLQLGNLQVRQVAHW